MPPPADRSVLPGTLRMHPDYPPRARIEWVIAGARVVLAVGALFAVWVDPGPPSPYQALTYALLAMYLIHSVATLALVWKPVEFARGWGLAGHVFDLAAFTVIMAVTEGASSPFYVFFVFSVICGALRWESKGALLTAAAALAAYAVISGYDYATNPGFQTDRFVIRIAQLTVVAALLAYLSSYHPRTLREVLRLASWPHVLPKDEADAVADIIQRAKDMLPAPRILLIWQQRDEDYLNVAWSGETGLEWIKESKSSFEPLVAGQLDGTSFLAKDAANPAGRVDFWHKGRFRELSGGPINDALRTRFDIHAVQSSRLEGGVIDGRVFWLDRRRMRIDDLIVGDLVAHHAASWLEGASLVTSLGETAALNERLRVARDLHDSVLQSLAGTGVQLAIATRLLDRDLEAAGRALQGVRRELERSEREMRALIRRLRPPAREAAEAAVPSVASRLEAFRARLAEQWKVPIAMEIAPEVEDLAPELREQLLLIVQEAVFNAARHANASSITASARVNAADVAAEVIDNGHGFPFTGSYDLAALHALKTGPLILKERVLELRGDLHIDSGPSGSTVRITLPQPLAIPIHDGHLTRTR